MQPEFSKILRCPECAHNGLTAHSFELLHKEIESGILSCPECRSWYPIIESIPIVTQNPLLTEEPKKSLRSRWAAQFDFSILKSNSSVLNGSAEEELQRHQIEHYTHEAEEYDEQISNTVFWKSVASLTMEPWARQQKKAGRILEIGCGTGNTTLRLIEAGHKVVSMDICFAAVREVVKKVRAKGIQNSVYFAVCEAEVLPFEPDFFEACLFSGVLHHVSDPAKVMGEIGRVLKEGGTVYGFENNATIFRFIFDFLMRVKQLWHEEAGAHPLISSKQIRSWGKEGGLEFKTSTMVYLPPHLFNLLPLSFSTVLLSLSDRLFNFFPGLRNHGGLIVLSGTKRDAAKSAPKTQMVAMPS